MFKRLLTALTLILALTVTTVAGDTVIIRDDLGGKVESYISRWQHYQTAGTQVVIAGTCASACVRFMTLARVCATDQGYFYMHGITLDDGKVDRQSGVDDTKDWETKLSYDIQMKYDAYSFGKVIGKFARITQLEPGISLVYWPAEMKGGRRTYFKLLRVKATLLVPRCTKR